jgi:hypothetical protein
MQLQEIDTVQDLKLYEDMYGTLVIRTNLGVSMGGYLFERGEEL